MNIDNLLDELIQTDIFAVQEVGDIPILYIKRMPDQKFELCNKEKLTLLLALKGSYVTSDKISEVHQKLSLAVGAQGKRYVLNFKNIAESDYKISTKEYIESGKYGREFCKFLYYAVECKDNRKKKFFIIQGPKDSGKTTFVEKCLNAIFKNDYGTPSGTEGMSRNYNKSVAGIDELKQNEYFDNTTVKLIKTLTGNAPMIESNEKYGACRDVLNRTKLLITTNYMPELSVDDIDDMDHRSIVGTMNNDNRTKTQVVPNELDADTLYSIGRAEGEKDDNFHSDNDYKQQGLDSNNAVLSFFEEKKSDPRLIDNENGRNHLYSEYGNGCIDNGIKKFKRKTFIRVVKDMLVMKGAND